MYMHYQACLQRFKSEKQIFLSPRTPGVQSVQFGKPQRMLHPVTLINQQASALFYDIALI